LLAEAGYENGLQLTVELPEAQNFPDLAVVLKEQLAEVGIELGVEVVPESVYYGGSDWMDANFGITGWGSRPYPQFYLEVMLTCEGQWNESRFCDPEFDAWVATAGSSIDEDVRREAYHQIQHILIERGPIIIPFFFAQLGAQRDSVDAFQMKPFPGRSDFRPVTLVSND
jgi:peptide/nickel transport system substrate-binding protein